MKRKEDFKVMGEVAVLEGVSYQEEAKIVEEYLKEHEEIRYVRVVTKDGRGYELKDSSLIRTQEDRFINPYYREERKQEEVIEEKRQEEVIRKEDKTKESIIKKLEEIITILKG